MAFASICVFAGSNSGTRPEYLEAARALGRTLAERKVGVVYGGGKVGLMGALADAALAAGAEVTGVIPESLMAKEVGHRGLTALHVVKSMHERKAMMASLSDGFVALPGGWGTLEELFEVLTWGQLGLHRKPCGLLNAVGYFDPLLAFLEHAVEEGFVRREQQSFIQMETAPEALLDRMAAWQPPTVEKWITPAQS
jgi:uncharacterized protein (TIGR00730 family)